MKILRMILIIAATLLCICFLVQLVLSVHEMQTLHEFQQKTAGNPFIADVVPQHTVGGYHLISLILLSTVLFSKQYLPAFFVAALYMLLNTVATYHNLRTGFFGGDMCPGGGLCWRAIRRASWFDWTAAALLLLIFCLLAGALLLQSRATAEYPARQPN